MRNLIVTIIESSVLSIIAIIILGIIIRFTKKSASSKNRKIAGIIVVLIFLARYAFTFTFYGDMGGGSYIRIPLKKPFQILYDGDKEYAIITKNDSQFYNSPDVIKTPTFNRYENYVYGSCIQEGYNYFILDLKMGALHYMNGAEYAEECANDNISNPLELYSAEQYDTVYWTWFKNIFTVQ